MLLQPRPHRSSTVTVAAIETLALVGTAQAVLALIALLLALQYVNEI